jgi:hypothetical protein
MHVPATLETASAGAAVDRSIIILLIGEIDSCYAHDLGGRVRLIRFSYKQRHYFHFGRNVSMFSCNNATRFMT